VPQAQRQGRVTPQTKCPDQRDGVENQTLIWGRIKVKNNPNPFNQIGHSGGKRRSPSLVHLGRLCAAPTAGRAKRDS